MIRRKKFCVWLLAVSLLLGSAVSSSAFTMGDVDDDGIVRVTDALLVLRYIAGTSSLTYVQVDACNVDGSGDSYDPDRQNSKCQITDYAKILRQAYGIIAF